MLGHGIVGTDMYDVLRDGEFIRFITNAATSARERVLISTYVASVSEPMKPLLRSLSLAAKRGATVRVYLNGVGSEASKYNTEFADVAESLGIPVTLTSFFNHAKVAVIDDAVVIGSHNLVGPSRRRDISVAIRSRELADYVSEEVFGSFRAGTPWSGYYMSYLGAGAMVEVFGGIPILDKARLLIEYAVNRVSGAFFIATVSRATRPIYDALSVRKSSGVDVMIVLSGEPGSALTHNRKTWAYLRKRRIPVAIYPGMLHAKVLAVDEAVLIGSHNLTSASSAGRAEVSAVVWVEGTAEVVHNWVARLFEESEKDKETRTNDVQG